MRELFKLYMITSTMYFSLVLIALLLGIDIEIKPFKYSLRNLLERTEEPKWVKGKELYIRCNRCANNIPFSKCKFFLGLPFYKCDKCGYEFPEGNRDDIYQELENKLNSLYKDCKFKIIIDEDNIEILYNNEKYINDNNFLDIIFKISSEYLDEKELWKLVISYDVLNEMNRI